MQKQAGEGLIETPQKNLGTDVATPQGLIETPQMLLGIKDKIRQ